jgi:hypothetical protein
MDPVTNIPLKPVDESFDIVHGESGVVAQKIVNYGGRDYNLKIAFASGSSDETIQRELSKYDSTLIKSMLVFAQVLRLGETRASEGASARSLAELKFTSDSHGPLVTKIYNAATTKRFNPEGKNREAYQNFAKEWGRAMSISPPQSELPVSPLKSRPEVSIQLDGPKEKVDGTEEEVGRTAAEAAVPEVSLVAKESATAVTAPIPAAADALAVTTMEGQKGARAQTFTELKELFSNLGVEIDKKAQGLKETERSLQQYSKDIQELQKQQKLLAEKQINIAEVLERAQGQPNSLKILQPLADENKAALKNNGVELAEKQREVNRLKEELQMRLQQQELRAKEYAQLEHAVISGKETISALRDREENLSGNIRERENLVNSLKAANHKLREELFKALEFPEKVHLQTGEMGKSPSQEAKESSLLQAISDNEIEQFRGSVLIDLEKMHLYWLEEQNQKIARNEPFDPSAIWREINRFNDKRDSI